MHAAISGVVGGLFLGVVGAALAAFIFGGFLLAIVVVIVLPMAFHVVNRMFLDPCPGVWALLTAVVWLSSVLATIFGLGATSDVEWNRPITAVLAVVVPAAAALLMHPGRMRRTALGVPIAAIVALLWAVLPDQPSLHDQIREREQTLSSKIGTTIRPYVTSVDGYRAVEAPYVVDPHLVDALYRPADDDVDASSDFALLTESLAGGVRPIVCGSYLDVVHLGDQPEESMKCSADGDRWVRLSRSLHEVTVRRGRTVVRAVAARRVPLTVLTSAIANAQPMDDEQFEAAYIDR